MKLRNREFGKYISVCKDPEDIYWFAKINWSSIGPCTAKETERFIKHLQKAVEFVKKLKTTK